jgi:nuclease HARBI1
MKFQAIMLPNEMFGHLFGPHEGQRNDSFLLNKSGIIESCAEHAVCGGTDEDSPDEELLRVVFQSY